MTHLEHYARWSYEQLLLQQPHIAFDGMWRLERQHFVVCPEVATAKTASGEDLSPWFHEHCRVLGAPIRLVDAVPPGSKRVPESTLEDRVRLVSAPRRVRDVL